MIRLAVFDLDGTLAEIGEGSTENTVSILKELEEKGVRIAISSGKPSFYLCGYLRQIGLKNPIMIGENGGVIQFGIDLPPAYFEVAKMSKSTKRKLTFLKDNLEEEIHFPVWCQPDEVGLTTFFKSKEECDELREYFKKNVLAEDHLVVYEHADSFDVVPQGIDKKASLLRLMELLELQCDEVAAVGNGVNDYSMFEAAGYSIVIGDHDVSVATHVVDSIEEALALLMKKAMESHV